MRRDELLDRLNIASLALGAEDFSVPRPFQTFAFTGETILACDDVVAVEMECQSVFTGLVPGRLLLKYLKACTGEQIEFLQNGSGWQIQCGRTRLEFAAEDVTRFPFEFPKLNAGVVVPPEFFEGLHRLSDDVDDKGVVTWTSGIICDSQAGGGLLMGSTNGIRSVVSMYEVNDFDLSEEREFILPIKFCKIVLEMFKRFPDCEAVFDLGERYVVMSFKDAGAVFGKLILTDRKVELLDRAKEWADRVDCFVPITTRLVEGLKRAVAIADKEDVTMLAIDDERRVTLTTETVAGTVRDSARLTQDHPPIEVRCVSKLVVNKIDCCSQIAVVERLIGLKDADGIFVRFVSNRV